MKLVYAYLVIINAVGFLIMLADKRKAKKNLWRIPERTLIAVAALGGSLGVLLGMHTFRHKTKDWKFTFGVPMILAIQIIGAVILWSIC